MIRKLGLSSCGKKSLTPACLTQYKEEGLDALEISCLPFDALDFAALAKSCQSSGIELWSYHLPFLPFETNNIASLDREIRKKTVEEHSESIKKAVSFGMRNIVIHPSGEPNRPENRAEQLKGCKDCLAALAEICEHEGAVLAVEDLPRTCLGNSSEELLDLLSCDDRLKICFDTNHILDEDLHHFAQAIAGKIQTVHISDYDFIDERHWLPGEGKIDWKTLLADLDAANYRGPFLYEVGFAPEKTIKRRDLTVKDVARNKEEREKGRPLTVLGKPLV
ncbi:MAG: sugar phosphate isomerase/epimerase [Clostridia bacterium]|nr:sugar phosphate isomerase/epimerase [Clostridia bacterium]